MSDAALDHERVEQLVAAVVDRELPPRQIRLILDHVRICAHCRRELILQHTVARALAKQPPGKASAELRHRISQIGRLREPGPAS